MIEKKQSSDCDHHQTHNELTFSIVIFIHAAKVRRAGCDGDRNSVNGGTTPVSGALDQEKKFEISPLTEPVQFRSLFPQAVIPRRWFAHK